jgi:hypothetical protein
MHLLKFKTNDKEVDNTDYELSNAPDDDRSVDVKNTDIEGRKPSKTGKNNKKNTTESHNDNKTNHGAELDIPSRQDLLHIFEELVACIYQLELNRGKKDYEKEN